MHIFCMQNMKHRYEIAAMEGVHSFMKENKNKKQIYKGEYKEIKGDTTPQHNCNKLE